jgi:hypothetical protein
LPLSVMPYLLMDVVSRSAVVKVRVVDLDEVAAETVGEAGLVLGLLVDLDRSHLLGMKNRAGDVAGKLIDVGSHDYASLPPIVGLPLITTIGMASIAAGCVKERLPMNFLLHEPFQVGCLIGSVLFTCCRLH